MKVKYLLLCLPFVFSPTLLAQTLDDQLAAIADIRAEERAEKAAQQKQIAKKRAAEQAKREAKRIASEKARQARIAEKERIAREKAQKAEKRADELYAMELEERKMALELKRSEVNRIKAKNKAYENKADAFVEQDLADRGALRDRLQAESDATRAIGEGLKNNLTEQHKGFFK